MAYGHRCADKHDLDADIHAFNRPPVVPHHAFTSPAGPHFRRSLWLVGPLVVHARVLLRMCASLCRSSRTRLQHGLQKVLLERSARYQPLAASPVCAFYAARTALLVA